MIYKVVVARRAETDADDASLWIAKESPRSAARWYGGLLDAIATLRTNPHRCAIAAESTSFNCEVRELLYGNMENAAESIAFYSRSKNGRCECFIFAMPRARLRRKKICSRAARPHGVKSSSAASPRTSAANRSAARSMSAREIISTALCM